MLFLHPGFFSNHLIDIGKNVDLLSTNYDNILLLGNFERLRTISLRSSAIYMKWKAWLWFSKTNMYWCDANEFWSKFSKLFYNQN